MKFLLLGPFKEFHFHSIHPKVPRMVDQDIKYYTDEDVCKVS